MTEGIAAIAARVTQLQTQFAQLQARPAASASAPDFAATLATEKKRQSATAPAPATTTAPTPSATPAPAPGATAVPPTATGGVTKTREPSKVIGGGSRITPTMQKVIDEIDQKFGKFPVIGAWRADGGMPGSDHPTGKAADFMLNTNGRMPSKEQLQRGWDIANYAKDNAERLGIKYIIFAQHIWNPDRADEGWRLMSDRGSVTANHFDHPHISVKR
ncbi:hypothetical protein [Planomonospora parontospora]|uniref:hypothetical protein n=1 Tax=Planomonospora parontospora TaxID=58119 RepID=UPI00166F9FDE|nr:hypothetical protein [Planomonospora parontospora]GGL59172.1 hypothetical protein GCM10014719_70730 [Planomonospora parontospora subsp. antibiotica]GII20294.1 hypothetical protein Ppa05_70200 [Planomonospora parontospora subsp. antibiotica]